MSIYDDPHVPRRGWRTFSQDYEGYGYTSEGTKRLRPRPSEKRVSSRHPSVRGARRGFLLINPLTANGDRYLVSERPVARRVGLRLVSFLRRRGHLAFIY